MVKASAEASAELAAFKDGGGEISTAGEQFTQKISEGTNLEIQANQDATENIQAATENSTQETSPTDSKSEKNTREDILEKFLMTIYALEDEWSQFTKSKDFKNLPENKIERAAKKVQNNYKKIELPNKNFLEAALAYRNSMTSKRS